MKIKKIRFSDISIKNFYKDFLSEQSPVLITDIFEQFPSLEKWDISYLSSKLGNKKIKVNFANDGVYNFNEKTGKPNFGSRNINFNSYAKMLSKKNFEEKIYAQKISILRELPELKDELKILDYIPDKLIYSYNLWLGSGGNTTPLHFDYFNNFFIQLWGEKKFWLYSPADFYRLYPYSWYSMTPHLSKIDPSNLDVVKFPNALKAKQSAITISRGTILFLPSYWWHQVYSISTSISVNIWCEPSFKQKMVMAHFHSYLASFFAKLKQSFKGNIQV
jgi:hypothetical protein